MLNTLKQDLITAMKEHNEKVVSTLRMLIAAVNNKEIELRGAKKSLNDQDILSVLLNEKKKRVESADIYKNCNRVDLMEKELAEIAILEKYLPKQMDKSEIKAFVVTELKNISDKSFGSVMKIVVPKLKNKADGKLVLLVVKEILG